MRLVSRYEIPNISLAGMGFSELLILGGFLTGQETPMCFGIFFSWVFLCVLKGSSKEEVERNAATTQ